MDIGIFIIGGGVLFATLILGAIALGQADIEHKMFGEPTKKIMRFCSVCRVRYVNENYCVKCGSKLVSLEDS